MNFSEKSSMFFGLPKSLYWNIKWFGVKKGIKLPVLLGHGCKLSVNSKARIELPSKISFGLIKIGINCGPFYKGENSRTYFILGENAVISFKGKCNINRGSVINVTSGLCVLGNNFAANANFLLSCEKKIVMGENVLFGWNCTVIDGDGHSVIDSITHKKQNEPEDILVGNHVWVAANASLLKGCVLGNNSVVGYGSVVTGKFNDNGGIIAGVPGKTLKTNITWER